VLGVLVVTGIVEVLRGLERGVAIGAVSIKLPEGFQEIGLGVMMVLILILRPGGLTKGKEIPLPWRSQRVHRISAETAPVPIEPA
jgi:branched-chain amino acid transport system permease protein